MAIGKETAGDTLSPLAAYILLLAWIVMLPNFGVAQDLNLIFIETEAQRVDSEPVSDYELGVFVREGAIGLTQLEVIPPGRDPILLPCEAGECGMDFEGYASQEALRSDFPTGNYTFSWNAGSGSTSVQYPTSGGFPAGFVDVISPSHLSGNISELPKICWEVCPGCEVGGNVLDIDLENVSADFAFVESWRPPLTSGCVQPSVPLERGSVYALEFEIINENTSMPSIDVASYVDGQSNLTNTTFTVRDFVTIADTSGKFSGFPAAGLPDEDDSNPAINDNGTVAFLAALDAGGQGVFRGSGGSTATIADSITTATDKGGSFDLFSEAPSINDSGTVAFQGFLDQGPFGIFAGSGGVVCTIADSSTFSDLADDPSINNLGVASFWGVLSGVQGIFTASCGGSVTPIVNTSESCGAFQFTEFQENPSINDDGLVAFRATRNDGPVGIFTTTDGSSCTSIGETDGIILNFSTNDGPAINGDGTVAFHASLVAGGEALFAGTEIIADTSGAFSSFAGTPSINNAGTVAFRAGLDAGGEGIFTGPDPVADKVIAVGDPLNGSTVTQLQFFREGLNNSGEVAFYAALADGSEGIFRAPEPSSFLLGAVALIVATLVSQWRRLRRDCP